MEIRHQTSGSASTAIRIIERWVLTAALIAGWATIATPLFFGTGTAVAAEQVETTRDRPLPKRWRAQYINDPVFNSRVYVVEAGRPNGPHVLLVHGLGQSGYQDWWEILHALETEYRIVALDLPGFARSSIPAGELSPPRYARFLDWLIERFDLFDVNLIGHSLGAAIVLYQAGEYPSRIANVVLIDVAGVLQRVAFLREVAEKQIDDYSLPPLLSGYKKQLFDWSGRLVDQFMIQSQFDVTQILRRSDRNWNAMLVDQSNINAAISLLETNYSRVLSRLDQPVTIIWGRNDDVTPIRTGYLLHSQLATSAFRVIEGAGHVPMRSHTREFMERLRHALTHPPSASLYDAVGVIGTRGDLVCSNEPGETVSGNFDRIVIERCPGMHLVNVRARAISISDSDQTHLRHVEIDSDTVALDIDRSNVTATDLRASGDPAIRVGNSRLDLAGGILTAPGAALRVFQHSTVILSVSRVDSGIHKGFLHGAVLANDAVLDDMPKLRSQ